MKKGSSDFTNELDVVRLVRRMRSYGIALYYLTTRKERDLITRIAAFKPLRDPEDDDTKITWANIHNQNFKDRLQYNFFRRYSEDLLKLNAPKGQTDAITIQSKIVEKLKKWKPKQRATQIS